MKEHYVYKMQDIDNGIVYVFNVERTLDGVKLTSIYLVVIQNSVETKIILDVPGILKEIKDNPNSKANDKTVDTINQWFVDMALSENDSISSDILEPNSLTELLDMEVVGSTDYDDIVNELLNEKPKYH